MKTKFSKAQDYNNCYLKEYKHFNGDNIVTFNIIEVNFERQEITLAVTNQGKISVLTYDLKQSTHGRLFYFEYGIIPELIFQINLCFWWMIQTL